MFKIVHSGFRQVHASVCTQKEQYFKIMFVVRVIVLREGEGISGKWSFCTPLTCGNSPNFTVLQISLKIKVLYVF
jgi:hypothetical protein